MHHSPRVEEEYTNYCADWNKTSLDFIPAVMHTQRINNSIYFYGHGIGYRNEFPTFIRIEFCQLSNYYDWLQSKAGTCIN